VNEEKTRIRDLTKGESFGFLGFEIRRVRTRSGRWMPLRTPQAKKATAIRQKLKECFRRYRSQPLSGLIATINPILRGWVTYFSTGHSSQCFSRLRDWVEAMIRRHLAQAQKRRGFGWKRWDRQWLYDSLGLFNDYRVKYVASLPQAAPA